jgi:hypothetical protein
MINNEIRINNEYASCLKSEYDQRDADYAHKESTPIVRQSLLKTEKYLDKMMDLLSSNKQPDIIPPNCRYLEKINGNSIVVIEEPPAYRTITVDSNFEDDLSVLGKEKIEKYNIDRYLYIGNEYRPYKFTLAMPYVVFMILINDRNEVMAGRVFFRKSRIIGLGDTLYLAPLLNISNNNYVCFGGNNTTRGLTLNRTVENTIDKFWASTFNTDYTCNYTAYKHIQYVNTYIEWQAMSKINPMFIYQVDWIDTNKSICDSIENIKSNYYLKESGQLHYQTLEGLFTRPIKIHGSEGKDDSVLFYDISQSLKLSEEITISIGDSFMWGGNLVYIDSFLGRRNINKIRLKLSEEKYINIENNIKVRDYILNAIKRMRYETQGILKNGVVIKENDIIIIELNGRPFYRKVGPIRRNMDGLVEGKLGKEYFILENIEGRVFNIEKDIYYDNIRLNIGNEYIITESEKVPFSKTAQVVKFIGFNILEGSSSNIVMEFRTLDNDTYKIELNTETLKPRRDDTRLYDKNECEQLPLVFRSGTSLYAYKGSGSNQPFVLKTKDSIISNLAFRDIEQIPFEEILNHILINDGNTLKIDGFDLNLEFSIGDRVVVADWINPENMLVPKTIIGVKVDKELQSIAFVLQDRNNNISSVNYINNIPSSRHNSYVIKVGKVRKIVSQYNGISAGTKIKSTAGHIPQFPKKNINIIIGFITDTGIDEPLVLCSNCCTIWFNDLVRDFELIPITSVKWKKMDHVEVDISAIKLQIGDIVSTADDKISYLLTCRNGFSRSSMGYINLNNYNHSPYVNAFDSFMNSRIKLDCIITPRMNKTELDRSLAFKGIYNLHGVYRESKVSYMTFKTNGRMRMHV